MKLNISNALKSFPKFVKKSRQS